MPGDHQEDPVADCADDVMRQGHDESSAYAICEASINDKSFEDTKLASMVEKEAPKWKDTVGRLVESDVKSSIIADVVKRAGSGSDGEARKAMEKSNRIEKVGFNAQMDSEFTVFKAGSDDFVIWGPASVEVVDKEGDKIQAKALRKALPQLLKRARLSLEHSDQLVGRILERFETDDPVEVQIGDQSYEKSEFPTDVLELEDMEPALFVAGEIYNDTRQAQETREKIEGGELTSYSISGEALVTQKKVTSDGDSYDDIVDLDLSAVTICEEGMNQHAKFAQISESGEKKASEATKSDDPVSPNGPGESPSVSAVASLAKSAINETMSKNNESSDNSDGSFDPEALTTEFKSVLDSKLPDGDLATKDDTLQREDVEDIAREVYSAEKEDEAGNQDDQDQGTSEAEGRPGEEADVEGTQKDHGALVDALSSYGGIDKDRADAFLRALKGDDDEVDPDEIEDPDDDDEEEMEIDPTEDDDMPPEGGDEEVPVPEEEEDDFEVDEEEVPEEEPPVPEEEEEKGGMCPECGAYQDDEEDEEGNREYKEGYTSEEMEEMLPADVWEVVREYLDEGAGAGVGGEEEEAADDGELMAARKSEDIESAVEKILSGKGLEKVGSAGSPGSDVEKSYDEEEPEDVPGHGNNPALATIYNE